MKSKKWIMCVSSCICILLAIFLILIYVIDPFFQFRVRDNAYMINCQYCASGLIKNYDYDTIIIGSSMTQNFNMNKIRTDWECNPLHISIGGMSDEDQVDYIHLANKIGKAKTYYLSVDISYFGNEEESKVTQYLVKDGLFSKIQYALSYEAWARLIPIDIALTGLRIVGKPFPAGYEYRTGIDYFGYWGHQATFSKEVVVDGYSSGENAVSEVDTSGLLKRIEDGIDKYISQIDMCNAEYVFFFPPYSSLYWCGAQDKGYFDIYTEAKCYFVEQITKAGGTVYDFQSDELTMNLDNYKDTTHYSPEINDWMVDCFSDKKYLTDESNSFLLQERLKENTAAFRANNENIFKVQ